MKPVAAPPDYARWAAIAELIHDAFAYMEPVLGHPARAASVTPEHLAEAAQAGTAFVIENGARPVACLFTRPSRDIPNALYLGWLAVASEQRGHGLANALIHAAEAEGRDRGYPTLTLDTARALTDLHAVFHRLGFSELPGDGEIVTFTKPVD